MVYVFSKRNQPNTALLGDFDLSKLSRHLLFSVSCVPLPAERVGVIEKRGHYALGKHIQKVHRRDLLNEVSGPKASLCKDCFRPELDWEQASVLARLLH